MFKKLKRLINLISNVGVKSVINRFSYDLKKSTGLIKSKFPTTYQPKKFIGVNEWRKLSPKFFFNSKDDLKQFNLEDKSELKKEFQQMLKGYLKFFNSNTIFLGKDYDWITNPENDFKFELKHWTEIESSKLNSDDIKYVWEKSRFTYLYTILRYDFHFNEDQSSIVFKDIDSWINSNPLNQGPNYIDSQEISLRVLNWIFALNYYKKSGTLSDDLFQKIMNSIYWQVKHVEAFIKIAQSINKYAVAESLLLYVSGVLFPFFEESALWKETGKSILEQEGFKRINEDGTFAGTSMNDHRSILQLYTWAFNLSKLNKDSFSTSLYERLQRSVSFLYHIQDNETGYLPNYGSNDGTIYFPLNACHFRDFRPQLNALFYYLHGRSLYDQGPWEEDLFWFTNKIITEKLSIQKKTKGFEKGGYYILRDDNKSAFIKCTSHNEHPTQADNLHLDIWVDGKNILRDLGSFKSKNTPEEVKFFTGTASHNTIMIGNHDQMEKGEGNIWYFWSNALESKIELHREWTSFTGKIHAFKHVGSNIYHTRVVKQFKHRLLWEVEDIIENNKVPVKQIWNISPEFIKEKYEITAIDKSGKPIPHTLKEVNYTPLYGGSKEPLKQLIFESTGNYFKSIIFKK